MARFITPQDRTSDGDRRSPERNPPLVAVPSAAAEGAANAKSPQSARLLDLTRSAFRLGRSDTGAPFAVPLSGPNVAVPFRGDDSALRRSLASLYARKFGSAPSHQALSDVLRVLGGHADALSQEALPVRVAKHGDAVVIDLGDAQGRAVVVNAAGWTVVARSPVTFRRAPGLTGVLPVPQPSGRTFSDLAQALGLQPYGREFTLLEGWCVAALIPDIAHPVLLLTGEQGSGKTTIGHAIVDLLDPSPAALRSVPRPRDWPTTAKDSWIIGLDNLSSVPDSLADALCTAVTGDAYVARQLYSDDSTIVVAFRRCVIVTSIGLGAIRGDLGDRLLTIDLPVITPSARQPERVLKERLESLRPEMLAALLDRLVGVLGCDPAIMESVAERPRMADYFETLVALDATVPGVTSYATTYLSLAGDLAEDVIQGDVFVSRVRDFLQASGFVSTTGQRCWTGSMSELLEQSVPSRRPVGWPTSAAQAASRLKTLEPALRAVGVQVSRHRSRGRRIVQLLQV